MNAPAPRLGTVVVIGAGMAGLVAARVISERADRVLIVERDAVGADTGLRRGVPQGDHAHGLLAVGQEGLERLLPGLTAELIHSHGAVEYDMGRILLWHLGGSRARFSSGVRVIGVSRPLLERCVRRRVLALPNVELCVNVATAGLLGQRGQRVTGVRLVDGASIEAQLVVDASGRGARSDEWLRQLGFTPPAVESITVRLGYATRFLRRSPDADLDVGALAIAPTPPDGTRFGAAMAIDGERWVVSLGGFHGDYPAADPAGFQRFAASLPHPSIAELLAGSTPLTGVATYRFPASRWRRFDRVRHLPGGYLAIGDAVSSFNPVYGQGMTVAVASALTLGRVLDRHGGSDSAMVRDFYRESARVTGDAWELARAADFWHPETTGRRPAALKLRNWYMRQVVQAAQSSVGVHDTLIRVQHLLAPAYVLGRPATILATLRGARRARANAADAAVSSAARPTSQSPD